MEEARSFEAIAFPFTVGLAAGLLLPEQLYAMGGIHLLGGLACLGAVFMSLLMLWRGGGRMEMALLMICTGLCCTAANRLGGSVSPPAGGLEALKDLLAGLPFPHERTAPLLTALFTGDRTALGRDTLHIFRSSGASHILALSGLHLGILYLVMTRVLSILGNSPLARIVRSVVAIVPAGAFCLATGASPSLVRAFLFILLGEACNLLHRPRNAWHILLVALTLQAAIDPSQVATIGFQLSYLAMTGIILIFPILDRWYPADGRFDPIRKVWRGAALTLSCQLTTAPLAWLTFHTFPRHFLLTNLLAMPLTTLLMVLGITTVALGAAGICPMLLIRLTDLAASALLFCLEVIAGM